MRRPLQDTPTGYLLHQAPDVALAADQALLEHVQPGGPPAERWYVVDQPAVVLGLAMHRRAAQVVDLERCARAGVQVLERRAGGGAVLLDAHMLCYAVALGLPDRRVPDDLTASYRWLGEHFASRLRELGVAARRVEVDEARADVAQHRGDLLMDTCYGVLSPHEVVVDAAWSRSRSQSRSWSRSRSRSRRKLVGLAQVRRRHAALFQVGVLLRDQSGLADLLRVPDETSRQALRAALESRTVGLADLVTPVPDLDQLMAALSPGPGPTAS